MSSIGRNPHAGWAGWFHLLAFSAVCLLASPAWAEQAVPALSGRVVDLTQTLTASESQALSAKLAALEGEKGSQIAVLLVPTTQPEGIEQYGIRVAETWKLGRKGVDDGILLLIAKQDRALRIEVGYGLEGVVPDAVAKRIIAEIMLPRLRDGDFAGGVNAGVDALINLVRGEPLPQVKRAEETPAMDELGNALPAAFLFIVVMGGILRAMLGRLLGAGVAGGFAFLGAWLWLGSLWVALVVALIIFVFTLAGGVGGGIYRGGGRSGGGGFGGGGFSGGGGGFGGGGASGRW